MPLVGLASTLPHFSARLLWSTEPIRLVARSTACWPATAHFVGTIGFLLGSKSVTNYQEIRIPDNEILRETEELALIARETDATLRLPNFHE